MERIGRIILIDLIFILRYNVWRLLIYYLNILLKYYFTEQLRFRQLEHLFSNFTFTSVHKGIVLSVLAVEIQLLFEVQVKYTETEVFSDYCRSRQLCSFAYHSLVLKTITVSIRNTGLNIMWMKDHLVRWNFLNYFTRKT